MSAETAPEEDRYAVILVDRATGEPRRWQVYEGPDAADEAHATAARKGRLRSSHIALVVGLR